MATRIRSDFSDIRVSSEGGQYGPKTVKQRVNLTAADLS